MRKRAEWMKPVDERILEYLEDEGAGTPKSIANAFDMNNDYVGVRCRLLVDAGLLTRVSRGLYSVTSDGEEFLSGELDATTLEDPS